MGSSTENRAFVPTPQPVGPGRASRAAPRGGSAAAVAAGEAFGCARHRHGRLHPPAGGALRRRRAQADLRARVALRRRRVRLVARPDRAHSRARARTRRALLRSSPGTIRCDATSRRSAVPDYRPRSSGDVARPAPRRAARVLRRGHRPEVRDAGARGIDVLRAAGRRDRRGVAAAHRVRAGRPTTCSLRPRPSRNLARYDGVRYGCARRPPRICEDMYGEDPRQGFGAEVKRRIMLGTYASPPATTTPTTARPSRSAR